MSGIGSDDRRADEARAARRGRMIRKAASAAAAVAVFAGVLGITGVVVVRRQLLDASLYRDALVRAEVYDRVYREVLADPELSATKEDLLGDLELAPLDPAAARMAATSSLRWAIPPETIRVGTEASIDALIGYLRGDTDRLELDVGLDDLLARLDDVAIARARAAVAAAEPVVAPALADYRAAVTRFLDDVADGRVPAQVPVAAADLADDEVMRVLEELAGVADDRTPSALRTEIDAAVLADDDPDALAAAMTPALAAHAREVASELRSELEDGRAFDAVDELVRHTGQQRAEIEGHLALTRDTIRWLTGTTLVVSIALVVVGVAALVGLHRRTPRTAGLVIAGTLVLTGAAAFGAWLLVRHGAEPPLHPATSIGPGTWNLPGGLRNVIADVEGNLASALDAAIFRAALVPVVAGALLAGALLFPSLAPRWRPVLAIGSAGVLVLAAVVLWPAGHPRTCNRHAELCDRPYDEVVQVATHNAMSSPDVVDFWPEQDTTMGQQLDAGVRTLLIDTHYWTAVDSAERLARLVPDIPDAVAELAVAAEPARLQARPGPYLCHVHCALGGQPLVEGLEEIRSFLDGNPHDVVTLIVQDAITPADTEAAFTRAGLTSYLYRGDPGDGWPTLGELVDRDERLVVFAENEGSATGWYRPAFRAMQDTPFGFPSIDEMSCAPNRGPRSAGLFLMNHWVTSAVPDRTTASAVNDRRFVVDRARRCAAERGRLPNFVAVDFSDIGDVTGAVDELNGVAG